MDWNHSIADQLTKAIETRYRWGNTFDAYLDRYGFEVVGYRIAYKWSNDRDFYNVIVRAGEYCFEVIDVELRNNTTKENTLFFADEPITLPSCRDGGPFHFRSREDKDWYCNIGHEEYGELLGTRYEQLTLF